MLKEITEQTEGDLNDRIRELEEDQAGTEQLRDEKTVLEAEVAQTNATIEDLRQQLDAATSWEEVEWAAMMSRVQGIYLGHSVNASR